MQFGNIITNSSNYLCGLVYTMQADYHLLKKYVASVFTAIGCSEQDAALASDVLVSADARGIDSHGVARLAGYVRLFDNGRLNTKPQVKILHETPSTATLVKPCFDKFFMEASHFLPLKLAVIFSC